MQALLTPIDDMPAEEAKAVLEAAHLSYDKTQQLSSSSVPVTYGLYRKFWRLQQFFTHQTHALDNFEEFVAVLFIF